MKQNNTFVIITPSFNQSAYIGQTIATVLNQPSLKKLMVMDGGSSDGTKELLSSIKNEKLTWESKQDNGQADAINKGLTKIHSFAAQDTIVAYLNSDDFYLPHAFEIVAKAFGQHPEKMWLVGDAIIVNEKNKVIQQPIRWYKKVWRFFLSKLVILMLNPIPQPAVFIRFPALKRVGKFNEKLYYTMDYEYWLRLFDAFGSPITLNQVLAGFRIHRESKGETGFQKQFAEELEVSRSFTKNPLVLLLHKLHNLLITMVYSWLK